MQLIRLLLLMVLFLFGTAANADSGWFTRSKTSLTPVPGATWTADPTDPAGNIYFYNSNGVWVQQTPPFFNLLGIGPPGTGNDNTEGYAAGSVWYDTSGHQVYICSNAATGAAVWSQFSNSSLATFTVGALAPLFSTTFNSASTPMLQFALQNANAKSWFGNASGTAAAPQYNTTPLPENMGGSALTGSIHADRLWAVQHSTTTTNYSSLTSTGGTITITFTDGNINLDTNLGTAPAHSWYGNATAASATPGFNSFGTTPYTFLGLNGTPLPAMLNLVGAGGLTVTGSGNTITLTAPSGGGGSGWSFGGTGADGARHITANTSDGVYHQYNLTTLNVDRGGGPISGVIFFVPNNANVQCNSTATVSATIVPASINEPGPNPGGTPIINPATGSMSGSGGGSNAGAGGNGGPDPTNPSGPAPPTGGITSPTEMKASACLPYPGFFPSVPGSITIAAVGAIDVSGEIDASADGGTSAGSSGANIQLLSSTSILIDPASGGGVLDVHGSDGSAATSTVGDCGGGGGGYIILFSPSNTITGATLNVNGGAAGGPTAGAGTSGTIINLTGNPNVPYVTYLIDAAKCLAKRQNKHYVEFTDTELMPLALQLMPESLRKTCNIKQTSGTLALK